jgi:hypothetical protein
MKIAFLQKDVTSINIPMSLQSGDLSHCFKSSAYAYLELAIAQVHSRQARNLICIDISTCAPLHKLKLATNHNFC